MKNILFVSIAFLISAAALTIFAASKADIVFPVAELGGCKDEQSCRTYCNDPTHLTACLNFAEKYNLMSANDLKRARSVGEKPGPGGCRAQECETYCKNPANSLKCLEFALNNPELLATFPEEEVEEMRKVQAALAAGAKLPGGCGGKEDCQAMCDNPPNEAVAEQCFDFALKAGFLPPEMTENPVMMQMAKIIMREGGPNGCRREECEDVFMDDPEAGFAWMKAHGINPADVIPPEAREEMMEGMDRIDEMLEEAPDEVRQCVEKALGGTTEDVRAGRLMPSPNVRYDIESCMMDYYGGMMGGGGPPSGMRGGDDFEDFEDSEDDVPGIPEECQSSNPQAVMTCMMNYCKESFMSGQPDPVCLQAMRQGVSVLISNNQLTAESSNIFETFVGWFLGR